MDDFELKGAVIEAAGAVADPVSGDTILDAHMLEDVDVSDGAVTLKVLFPKDYPKDSRWAVEDGIADAVEAIDGVKDCSVSGFVEGYEDAPPAASPAPAASGAPAEPAPKSTRLDGVGRVIAVASGKGGVGKSTVAVNLALGLQQLGHSVGLLDIDVYGPSLPTLLGINARPNVIENKIIPLEAHGLKLMSLGFLMEDDSPVIWRGPIVTGIIRQFLQDVDWAGIDYLIVDMPPGTGDAQLSLAQTVDVDSAVVVTTPSDLALIDAARGLRMFNTLKVNVLGIVENMSYFAWPGEPAVRAALADLPEGDARKAIEAALDEHGRTPIFGSGGGRREAERLETDFLGEIPLDPVVRKGGDEGRPVVAADIESSVAQAFVALARRVAEAEPVDTEKPKSAFSFLKS